MTSPADQLLSLPLLTDHHRAVRAEADSTLQRCQFIKPTGSGVEALRAATKELGRFGLLKHAIAEPGRGLQLTNLCLVREAVAQKSVIADLAFVMQALGSLALQMAGAPELREEWLPRVADGSAVSAFALTEPEAGSDLAAIACSAVADGDSYVVSGEKHLISNIGAADFYCLFARVEPNSGGPGGITCFFLPADTPGLSFTETPPVSPHPLGKIHLHEARVPERYRIGPEGGGLKLALRTLAQCRPSVAAAACGFAMRGQAIALQHVQQRTAFGGVLSDLQLVQSMLAHNQVDIEASRLLTWRCTVAMDASPEARHDRLASQCKWFATEAAQRVIDRAVQMVGGVAVCQGHELADLYNAIRPLRIYEGASEVQQVLIARSLLNS